MPLAQSFSLSKKLRGRSPTFGARIARTTPPLAITDLKALNSTSSRSNTEVTSVMTSGLRRSGLSLPYFSIDSA